jgi:Tfp pilus assembly protein PilN
MGTNLNDSNQILDKENKKSKKKLKEITKFLNLLITLQNHQT